MSGPSITLRLKSLGCTRDYATQTNAFALEYGLAPSKDLAVSSPRSYPYRGAKPSTLGSGFPSGFPSGRFCSHLYAFARRPLAATFADFAHHGCRKIVHPEQSRGISLVSTRDRDFVIACGEQNRRVSGLSSRIPLDFGEICTEFSAPPTAGRLSFTTNDFRPWVKLARSSELPSSSIAKNDRKIKPQRH